MKFKSEEPSSTPFQLMRGEGNEEAVRGYDTMISTASAATENVNSSNIAGADDDAKKTLTVLDGCADELNQPYELPKVTAEEIAPPVRCCDVLGRFQWPLTSLSVVATSALAVIYFEKPVLYKWFPYFASLVNYMGGLPSMFMSLHSMAETVIPRLESMELTIKAAAQSAKSRASEGHQAYSEYLQKKKNAIYESFSWNSDTAEAQKSSDNVVKSYAVSSNKLEEDLNSNDLISENGKEPVESKNVLRGSRHVPRALQSKEHFHLFVSFPLLLIYLLFQLGTVWYLQLWLDIFKPVDERYEIRSKYSPLTSTISSFCVMMFQIWFTWTIAKASRAASIVNYRARKRSKDVTQYRQKAGGFVMYIRKRLIEFINFLMSGTKLIEAGKSFVNNVGSSINNVGNTIGGAFNSFVGAKRVKPIAEAGDS